MGTGSLAYKPPTVVSIAAPSEGSSAAIVTVLDFSLFFFSLHKGSGFGPGPAGSYNVAVSIDGADFISAVWLSQTTLSCPISAAATSSSLSNY